MPGAVTGCGETQVGPVWCSATGREDFVAQRGAYGGGECGGVRWGSTGDRVSLWGTLGVDMARPAVRLWIPVRGSAGAADVWTGWQVNPGGLTPLALHWD